MRSRDFKEFLKTVLPTMGYQWRRFDRRNIKRRVRSRMESMRIHELEKYARLVEYDKTERDVLDSLLRLTITRFFRNAWLWSDLGTLILMIDGYLGLNEILKIWSAGCAGGEEAFSMAMLLDDLGGSGRLAHPWTILGTDTDTASLVRTKAAGYRWGSVREIPETLLERWFEEKDGFWFLDENIRKMVKVRRHDLLTSDPPGQFHLVLLRNSVLTYNTEEVQRMVLDRVRECLLEPGYLITGRTETVPEGTGFDQVSRCIYQLV